MSQPAFDFGDTEVDDATNPTYSVGELADAINDTLRRGFSDGVWVRGEISGWSDRGNHAYFSLADDSGERADGRSGKAVVNVQFFANARMRLRPMLRKNRLRLADGMRVRIFGYLDYYAPTGRIGLKMTGIDPRYTLGEIAQSRDAVVRRLVAEGLLDANKRHRLAAVPLRVGVVTSVGTAAWHDFHDELQRSQLGFSLTVVDTRVQGGSAERMVAASIATLGARHDLDVIAVIRGGGARNDLSVFDAEVIARAVATSPIPVLTGLGHEVDRSVADEVAHTMLKTPTACAGALIERVRTYCDSAEQAWSAIVRAGTTTLVSANGTLTDTTHRIARRTHEAVGRADERLDMRVERLGRLAPAATIRAERRLTDVRTRCTASAERALERATAHLDIVSARVASLDPAVQLARGWSITRRTDGAVVRSIHDVEPDDIVTTTLVDGTITSATMATAPADTAPSEPIQATPLPVPNPAAPPALSDPDPSKD